MQRTARLFMNGRSQAVRLTGEFRFEGEEVNIRKDPESGDVILSRRETSWQDFFRLRDALTRKELDAFQAPRDSKPARVPKLS